MLANIPKGMMTS